MKIKFLMLIGGFFVIGLGVVISSETHSPIIGFAIGLIGGAMIGKS